MNYNSLMDGAQQLVIFILCPTIQAAPRSLSVASLWVSEDSESHAGGQPPEAETAGWAGVNKWKQRLKSYTVRAGT